MNTDKAAMIERRADLLGPAYRLFYDEPLHIVRGEGVWLFDADGRRYLDLYNNVPHVGHCHPFVVDAITKQLGQLNTHTRYLHDNVLNYAERLTAKLPDGLDTAMFACTGSEANELALRIARAHTQGEGIIVCEFAYHGNTRAIYEISSEDIPEEEIPEFVEQVPFPDVYRGKYRGADAASQYAAEVQVAVDRLRDKGIKPAAFVIDTIMSSSGVITPPVGYMARAAEIVRAAGGLFIADEVQPGFGRTGANFWGFEVDDVVPDIVTMGKPMGNGFPLSAVVTRREIVETFADGASYFNTFGGNPVACAAGLAVLEVIEQESLQENALRVGDYLAEQIRDLASRHPIIGDVRGAGLFLAVEIVSNAQERSPDSTAAAAIVAGLLQRGVLIGSIGPDDNILKLRPPMVFTQEHADLMLDALRDTLDSI